MTMNGRTTTMRTSCSSRSCASSSRVAILLLLCGAAVHICSLNSILPTTLAYTMDMMSTPKSRKASGSTTARSAVSSPPSTRPWTRPTRSATTAPVAPGSSVTSTLISQLAIVALKMRLAEQSSVDCSVIASSTDVLLRGEVGPVTVWGRNWQSPLGLTCRAIKATVYACCLDMPSIVSRRKLVLTEPAKGDAMIALNSADFGNFITHPLLQPPAIGRDESTIKFHKDGVEINNDLGAVVFYGSYMGEKWQCFLTRGPGKSGAVATVTPTSRTDEDILLSEKLSNNLTEFFNSMVFNLDGTFLSFKDMMVTGSKKKGDDAPFVMLALRITVKKFPSPGLAF